MTIRTNFALSQSQKDDARAAIRILEGHDMTLTEAAKLAVETKNGGRQKILDLTVDAAVARFFTAPVNQALAGQTVRYSPTRAVSRWTYCSPCSGVIKSERNCCAKASAVG